MNNDEYELYRCRTNLNQRKFFRKTSKEHSRLFRSNRHTRLKIHLTAVKCQVCMALIIEHGRLVLHFYCWLSNLNTLLEKNKLYLSN